MKATNRLPTLADSCRLSFYTEQSTFNQRLAAQPAARIHAQPRRIENQQ